MPCSRELHIVCLGVTRINSSAVFLCQRKLWPLSPILYCFNIRMLPPSSTTTCLSFPLTCEKPKDSLNLLQEQFAQLFLPCYAEVFPWTCQLFRCCLQHDQPKWSCRGGLDQLLGKSGLSISRQQLLCIWQMNYRVLKRGAINLALECRHLISTVFLNRKASTCHLLVPNTSVERQSGKGRAIYSLQ